MSDFNFADLYSTDVLIPKETKFRMPDGSTETTTVYVKRLPAVELRRFQYETVSDDENVRLHSGFRALSMSIRKEDGSIHFTKDAAAKLPAPAIKELMRVFTEVHTPTDDDLGNS